jgi:hypothetical protein
LTYAAASWILRTLTTSNAAKDCWLNWPLWNTVTVDENANTDSSVSLLTDLTDRWLTRHHFNNNSNIQHTTSPATTSARLKLHQSHEQLSLVVEEAPAQLVRVLSVLTELELYARTRPSHITEIQISFSSRSTRTSPTNTIKQSKSSSQQRSLQQSPAASCDWTRQPAT